jgi:hypothetical protein
MPSTTFGHGPSEAKPGSYTPSGTWSRRSTSLSMVVSCTPPATCRCTYGEGGGVPLYPPPGQPQCFGILFVLGSHDGEPSGPSGARGPLLSLEFDARGVQAAGSLQGCLRILPEGGAVSETSTSTKVEMPRCIPRRRLERADERTRTAFLLVTGDPSGVAEGCMGMQMPHI